jgi:hypothetical protein
MRRSLSALALVAAAALAVVLPASAAGTEEFKAHFHGSPSGCPPGVDTCGKGVVKGFGTVTTSLTFTGAVPGPGANCFTASADRVVTLDSDGSMLLLALSGTICGNKVTGTFVVAGGAGVFAGATGGGTIVGTAIPGEPSDTVHFSGTITLSSDA